jgi:PAS domain S-box-containing protein
MADRPIQLLIVEDNPADVLIVRELLDTVRVQRCEVTAAERLSEAITLARAGAPDVILLDLGLPDSDGLGSLSRLRRELGRVPIIVLTHLNDEDVAGQAARDGAQDYLVKGQFSGAMLVRSIRYAIERTRADDALRTSERLLQESEDRLRLAIDSTGLGAFDFLPPRGPLVSSEFVRRHFGVRSNIEVTYEMFMSGVHPEDRGRVQRLMQHALDGGGAGQFATEFRTIGVEDGEMRDVASWGRVYFDAGGQATRVVGVTLDVTDRKRAENTLREADRRKDEFLATLAHELRNPLAAIRFALNVLQRQTAAEPADDRPLRVIDRQVSHLVRLIDDLLDVSRLTRNKVQLRTRRVTLDAVLDDTVDAISPLAHAAGHVLDVRRPPHPVWLEADPDRLAQVFVNLITNAVKFTPPPGRITVSVEPVGSAVTVRVIDTGVGFSREAQSRLFEMFHQEDDSLERSTGGLGIGLTLARALIVMHGGRIEARSEGVGLGAEFIVTLPCARQLPHTDDDGRAAGVRGQPASGAPLRVLIVDDNRDAADMLQMFVTTSGHEAVTAHDGRSALAQAAAFRPQLILLDIGLPGMSGYEVARAIRGQNDMRDVYLTAITGWGQDEDRHRAREAGFDNHLTKPVNPSVLDNLLSAWAHTVACSGCERCLRRVRTRVGDSMSR